MKNTRGTKRQTIVLLRWVLIIAFSYLVLMGASSTHRQTSVAIVIAAVLSSNLAIARMPEAWVQWALFDFAVVLFDAAWLTLGLLWAPNVSGDLFLLYFLVIFVAAMGQSLLTIVGSAVVVTIVYGATLSMQPGWGFQLTNMSSLLRIPFLFVVALFYGYFVSEIRIEHSDAQVARLREQAKGELLEAVSHDLCGPLGNAENLLAFALDGDGPDVSGTRVLLLRAQVNVRRVNSLVTNLLQAACIEAGQIQLQRTPVQLNDVAADVVELEAGAALLGDITLRTELRADLPVVAADFMQMGRIVTNLVNNAIKYAGARAILVIQTAYDAERVFLSVHDSGPGMGPEQREALFAPYHRVHLGGYTPGTGLGLYIAKRLTEAQGGTITVQSAPGAGSSFTVSFPHIPVPGQPVAVVPWRALAVAPAGR